ncbi:MAG: ribonuclease III [Bacillota bacterium]|jgi:ribonuclease-3
MDKCAWLKDIAPALLREATTHSSTGEEIHNQRLEFLGDAVLSLIISDWLYSHPEGFSEGRMSQIRAAVVREESLATIARRLELGSILHLGKGEEKSGGRNRTSLLADALEAVIAAHYLSAGLDQTRAVVLELFEDELAKACSDDFIIDYKSELQETLQASGLDSIEYTVTKDAGPDHNKTFWVELSVGGKVLASGSGKTKKQAEQDAARKALNRL